MKILHSIVLSAFCKEYEDENKDQIKKKLIDLIPFDMKEEKILVEEENATGIREDHKIIIYKIKLEKSKHARGFLTSFLNKISEEQLKTLQDQIDSRLDDNCHFFIRIDKDEWFNDKIKFTDKGSCFHINISIAAYPSKKENALPIMKQILEEKKC